MLIIVFMAQLNQRNGKKSVKHSFWMLGRWTQGRKGHSFLYGPSGHISIDFLLMKQPSFCFLYGT